VFLSLALVAQTILSVDIPLFGQNGMRLGVSGVFASMPAVLFGPFYGAATFGLLDILGHLLRPRGPFMPFMTIIVIAGGFVRGFLWFFFKDRDNKNMRTAVLCISVLLLSAGILSAVSLNNDGINSRFYDGLIIESVNDTGETLKFVEASSIDTDAMNFISRLVVTRTINLQNPEARIGTYIIIMTWGFIGSGVFGLFLLAVDFTLTKILKGRHGDRIMPLFISLVLGAVFVTTCNTVLLRETLFAESWKLLPFTVVWLPRLIEAILETTLHVYFVTLFISVFESQPNLKGLARYTPGK
jgi:hypothetical protein